jgi:hypothetical protein
MGILLSMCFWGEQNRGIPLLTARQHEKRRNRTRGGTTSQYKQDLVKMVAQDRPVAHD